MLIEEEEIRMILKTYIYFEELLNEENPRGPLEETHPVERPVKIRLRELFKKRTRKQRDHLK